VRVVSSSTKEGGVSRTTIAKSLLDTKTKGGTFFTRNDNYLHSLSVRVIFLPASCKKIVSRIDKRKNKMKRYYVYILLCFDDTYYVGVTNNVERRLHEHQNSLNDKSYTSSRLPVTLECAIEFTNILEAIEFEKKIKKWSKAKKRALIEKQYQMLPELSKKKFC